jgi:hypothetical protein
MKDRPRTSEKPTYIGTNSFVNERFGDLATTDATTLFASRSFGFALEPFFGRSRSRRAAMLT